MALLRWLLLGLALLAAPAMADTRVALVIANAAYGGARLANPTVDAKLVAPVLEEMGFSVDTVTDADFLAMNEALQRFYERAKGADVALFYFAGHGFAINAERRLGVQNYLMSTSADVTRSEDFLLKRDGIPLDDIVGEISAAAKVSLVFVDACRNDPRVRAGGGTGRGLTRIADVGGSEVFVGLSTRLGDVAADGDAGEGSPFARAFAAAMPTPGATVVEAFRRLRQQVTEETRGNQRPEAGRDDLDAPPVLVAAAPGAASQPAPDPEPVASPPPEPAPALGPVVGASQDGPCANVRASYAEARDLDDAAAWRAFLAAFPDCPPETGFAEARLARLDAPAPPEEGNAPEETVAAVEPTPRPKPDEAAPPARRLPPLGTLVGRLEGHAGDVEAVALSPDGRVLASGATDDTIRLWRVDDGSLLRTIRGQGNEGAALAFAPASLSGAPILATGSSDAKIRLRSVPDGAPLRTLDGHGEAVTSVAFAPRGGLLASASLDRTVRLWRLPDGVLVRTLRGHGRSVSSVAVGPDGALLVSGSADRTAKIWRAADGALLHTLKAHGGAVTSVAFGPDGTVVASGGADNTVRVWRVSDGALLQTMEALRGVAAIAFSPDGSVLASGSEDTTVRLWRVSDGSLLRTIEGHGYPVPAVAFAPDGSLLASGSRDKTIRLWSMGPAGALARK